MLKARGLPKCFLLKTASLPDKTSKFVLYRNKLFMFAHAATPTSVIEVARLLECFYSLNIQTNVKCGTISLSSWCVADGARHAPWVRAHRLIWPARPAPHRAARVLAHGRDPAPLGMRSPGRDAAKRPSRATCCGTSPSADFWPDEDRGDRRCRRRIASPPGRRGAAVSSTAPSGGETRPCGRRLDGRSDASVRRSAERGRLRPAPLHPPGAVRVGRGRCPGHQAERPVGRRPATRGSPSGPGLSTRLQRDPARAIRTTRGRDSTRAHALRLQMPWRT